MSILEQNNVSCTGEGSEAILFVHGFGCDKSMWRQVAPFFEVSHRVVTYDLTGMGGSDLSAYDYEHYSSLSGHADDLLQIIRALNVDAAILVGHSIGASIAVLAANQMPERVAQLALVSPSPSFLNDITGDYEGGFTREDLEGLLTFLEENHLGWSAQMAPTIVGQPAGEPMSDELTQSFCRTDPEIAAHFGRLTFFADCRADMMQLSRQSLILHCNDDALVPMSVAHWMRDNIPQSTLEVLPVSGHCPHMTAPQQVVAAMRAHLGLP